MVMLRSEDSLNGGGAGGGHADDFDDEDYDGGMGYGTAAAVTPPARAVLTMR